MQILYIIPSLRTGGAQRVTLTPPPEFGTSEHGITLAVLGLSDSVFTHELTHRVRGQPENGARLAQSLS